MTAQQPASHLSLLARQACQQMHTLPTQELRQNMQRRTLCKIVSAWATCLAMTSGHDEGFVTTRLPMLQFLCTERHNFRWHSDLETEDYLALYRGPHDSGHVYTIISNKQSSVLQGTALKIQQQQQRMPQAIITAAKTGKPPASTEHVKPVGCQKQLTEFVKYVCAGQGTGKATAGSGSSSSSSSRSRKAVAS